MSWVPFPVKPYFPIHVIIVHPYCIYPSPAMITLPPLVKTVICIHSYAHNTSAMCFWHCNANRAPQRRWTNPAYWNSGQTLLIAAGWTLSNWLFLWMKRALISTQVGPLDTPHQVCCFFFFSMFDSDFFVFFFFFDSRSTCCLESCTQGQAGDLDRLPISEGFWILRTSQRRWNQGKGGRGRWFLPFPCKPGWLTSQGLNNHHTQCPHPQRQTIK